MRPTGFLDGAMLNSCCAGHYDSDDEEYESSPLRPSLHMSQKPVEPRDSGAAASWVGVGSEGKKQ